ncbi:Hypothetical protein D9617_15g041950 [Elsinoe fawcettii]|nr:Hypothetical protein D9617_15g041950 [Elsinoe fawcettii]
MDSEKLFVKENGVVVGHLEFPQDGDKSRSVTIVMGSGTTQSTGLHWHEEHNEYLQVLSGRAQITVGEDTFVAGPEHGTITVPAFTLHELGRADKSVEGQDYRDTELRIREWTTPADGQKEIFFRGVIELVNKREAQKVGMLQFLLSMFAFLGTHDCFPVVTKGPAILGTGTQGLVRRSTSYFVVRVAILFAAVMQFNIPDGKRA